MVNLLYQRLGAIFYVKIPIIFKNLVDKSTVYANFTGGKVELVIYIRLRKKGRK